MTTQQRIKQSKLANAAAAKKAIKAANHARLMQRQSAIKVYEAAFDSWCVAEEGLRLAAEERGEWLYDTKSIGPCPLNPRFYDFALFPENKPSGDCTCLIAHSDAPCHGCAVADNYADYMANY